VDPGVENPQAPNCAACPLNCSATNQAARDTAFSKPREERCQNRLTLVCLVPGHSIPYLLNLSASSFKHFASYAQRVGGQSRFLLHEVATRITFKKVGQYGHSEARFEMLGALPVELQEENQEANRSYLGYLRRTANMDRAEEAEATAKASAEAEAQDISEAPL
jgi:adenine-specific DNA glycosylase